MKPLEPLDADIAAKALEDLEQIAEQVFAIGIKLTPALGAKWVDAVIRADRNIRLLKIRIRDRQDECVS